MFDNLVDFWNQILSVFIGVSSNAIVFQYGKDYGTGVLNNAWALGFNRIHLSRFFAFVTLISLCVFLFYQMYKIIHALIGGVYENDV